MLEFIVISGVFLIVYHHLLYPLAMLIGEKFGKGYPRSIQNDDELPTLAMLIAARNEANSIAEKIDNSLSLNYPKNKLRIIVLANGCTDNTADIARKYSDRGVEVQEYGEIGKDESQNRAVMKLDSEIILFSDANTPYNQDALKYMVAPFQDKTVGAVSGQHLYVNKADPTGSKEHTYWSFENRMRQALAMTGGAIGAAGSIYAVRREVFVPVPPGMTSDLYAPLLIAANGYKTVYAPDAHAYERSEDTTSAEYERRVRIIRQSAYGVIRNPWLLNPLKTGRLAIVLFSHKILRWAEPFIAICVVLASLLNMIIRKGRPLDYFIVGAASIIGFLGLLGRGLSREGRTPVISHVYYILTIFKAVAVGVIKAFSEGGQSVWGHKR